MGQIEDSVKATILPTIKEKYKNYQETGFTVRYKDGRTRWIEGRYYMRNALNDRKEIIKSGLAEYIKKGVREARRVKLTPYITESARKLRDRAFVLSPVDTGALRESIAVKIESR